MSAAADREIADLDYTLALDGMDAVLRSTTPGNASVWFDVTVRAFMRGYRPDELVGGITQSHRRIIISPSEIIANGWPGPQSSVDPNTRDRRIPKKNDKIIAKGREYAVQDATGFYVDDDLCRIELQVLG